MTGPFFYNENIQAGKNTMVKKGVCCLFHLLHEHGDVLFLEEFDVEHGLNTDFLTYIMVCLGNKEF